MLRTTSREGGVSRSLTHSPQPSSTRHTSLPQVAIGREDMESLKITPQRRDGLPVHTQTDTQCLTRTHTQALKSLQLIEHIFVSSIIHFQPSLPSLLSTSYFQPTLPSALHPSPPSFLPPSLPPSDPLDLLELEVALKLVGLRELQKRRRKGEGGKWMGQKVSV